MRPRAFNLFELMAVIAIISIIATIGVFAYTSYKQTTVIPHCFAYLRTEQQLVSNFYLGNSAFPPTKSPINLTEDEFIQRITFLNDTGSSTYLLTCEFRAGVFENVNLADNVVTRISLRGQFIDDALFWSCETDRASDATSIHQKYLPAGCDFAS